MLAGIDVSIGLILTHGATERLNQAYRASGITLPPTTYAMAATKADLGRALICAPTSVRCTSWLNRFGNFSAGYVWLVCVSVGRAANVRLIVVSVLSDHVDRRALLATIKATGAERIGVTHGYVPVVVRYLREQGMDAYGIETRFSSEVDDSAEAAGDEEKRSEAGQID